MTALDRFDDVVARAREGDAEALEEFPQVAREVFAEGRALLTWRPAKHGSPRQLRYGEALVMLGDGVVRREGRNWLANEAASSTTMTVRTG